MFVQKNNEAVDVVPDGFVRQNELLVEVIDYRPIRLAIKKQGSGPDERLVIRNIPIIIRKKLSDFIQKLTLAARPLEVRLDGRVHFQSSE
jgi:hypothetical protein